MQSCAHVKNASAFKSKKVNVLFAHTIDDICSDAYYDVLDACSDAFDVLVINKYSNIVCNTSNDDDDDVHLYFANNKLVAYYDVLQFRGYIV